MLIRRRGEMVRCRKNLRRWRRTYLGCSETVEAVLYIQCTQRILKVRREVLCFGVSCDRCGPQGNILHPRGLEHGHNCRAFKVWGVKIFLKLTFSMSRQSSGTRFAVVIAIRNRPNL